MARSHPFAFLIGALFSAAAAALYAPAPARAIVVFGQNPYGNVIDTPPVTITHNSTAGGGSAPASDNSTFSSIFKAKDATPLFYQETWTAARNVQTVFLDSARSAGGNIYVATTSGGPVTTLVGNFSMPLGQQGTLAHIRQTGIFGVRVEVNSTTATDVYQLTDIEFDSVYLRNNLAQGAISIASPGTTVANLTDQNYNASGGTIWRASGSAATNGGVQWTGWEYAPGVSKVVRGLRVVSASPHGSTLFTWNNWDLELKLAGVWTPMGRAAMPVGQNIYWVDLGTMSIEGVRLFGSTAGGNNPTANGGAFIDDIYAFLPEPGGAVALLGLGGAKLLMRRRRCA